MPAQAKQIFLNICTNYPGCFNLGSPIQKKGSIYLELYCANPIIEVKTPANIQEIISYINENISFKYRIKPVRAIDMMYASERLKRIVTQHPEEQEQSLETYISRMQIELEEYDRLEYQPT